MAKMSVHILVDWESIKDHMAKSDIVEVIRCKDCKFLGYWHDHLYTCKNNFGMVMCKPNEYCSKAERKDNG